MNMEDMDIDQVVDIPDTPDRLAAVRRISSGEHVGKESNCSSYASLFRNPDFKNEEPLDPLKARNRLLNENGHHKKLYFHPPKSIGNVNGTQRRSNSIVISPLQNAYPKTDLGGKLKHETEHSMETQHVDKGKCLSSKLSSKSSAFRHDYGVLDLTEQSGKSQITEQVFPYDNNFVAEQVRKEKLSIDGSSLHHHHNSSNKCKGKGKLDMNTCNSPSLSIGRGKGIDLSCDSQDKTEKLGPGFLHCVTSPTSPKVIGRKRLVRNGCISPYNIAAQLADHNTHSSRDVECNHTGKVASSQTCFADTVDPVARRNNHDTLKGKGATIHLWPSKQNEARIIPMSGSSPVINNVEATETAFSNRDAVGNAVGCLEGSDGWRSTHNHSKNTDNSTYPPGFHSRRNEDVGGYNNQHYENRVEKRDSRSGKDKAECDSSGPVQTTSRIVSATGSRPVANILKRPKKHVLTMKNHGQCSNLSSNDSEIVFLGSTEESLNSRSSRMRDHRHRSASNPVIEIDELSPEIRHSRPQNTACSTYENSDARAIQVEADEMLARELQEQLYQEVPVISTEIDEHIARTLQQEEGALQASSSGNPRIFHPRASVITQNRQPQTRSRNPSIRRGTQGRAPTSTRMARLRNHSASQSHAVLSRGSTLQFPMDMDMDTRMDILEALESALGDFSDMGMGNRRLQVQRDFNENDYEMLLALDENTHSVGASSNQINNLPESTVNTDALEEVCAICLEAPTMGDIIRHLPCLHKFHKDCIDPWLSRKTSCPVCKLSIT